MKKTKDSLDYVGLQNKIYKKAYRLSEVKDQLETVAFDIVRFKDGDKGADLWQVQSAEDGDYIVALYDNEEDTVKTATLPNPWDVSVSKAASAIQVSYKGEPLVSLASSKLGIPPTELNKVPGYLPNKLAESKKLVKSLLNEMPLTARVAVLRKYPELNDLGV